jgi:hypothetical protein
LDENVASIFRVASALLPAGFLLGLFKPEGGDDMFLRNAELLSKGLKALYPRSQNSSLGRFCSEYGWTVWQGYVMELMNFRVLCE